MTTERRKRFRWPMVVLDLAVTGLVAVWVIAYLMNCPGVAGSTFWPGYYEQMKTLRPAGVIDAEYGWTLKHSEIPWLVRIHPSLRSAERPSHSGHPKDSARQIHFRVNGQYIVSTVYTLNGFVCHVRVSCPDPTSRPAAEQVRHLIRDRFPGLSVAVTDAPSSSSGGPD